MTENTAEKVPELTPALIIAEEASGSPDGQATATGVEKEYAPADADTDAAPKHTRSRRILKLIYATLSASVFVFAMYVELSAAVTSFVPDIFLDAVARLSLGGNFDAVTDGGGHATEEPSDTTDRGDGAHGGAVTEEIAVTTAEVTTSEPETEPPPETGGAARYPIVTRDLSVKVDRGLTCSNQTDYDLDLEYFADADLKIPPLADLIAGYPPDTDNPVVLIIHTHGTESYSEEGADSYAENESARSTDITKNVVAVGEVMAQYFESHGIKTIHCTEMFDAESYVDSYKNSSAAVREYLAIYPSIRYVFDVHRDSIISDDKVKTRPVTDVDGTPTAQYMCVIGTNAKGANHPNWRDNLTLAAHLQSRLWNRCNTLTRRMSVRSSSFYQQYTPGSLLFEIGSCGNTLAEAKSCALIVAEELAGIIIGEDSDAP